jgi:DnaJ-class molecular chaperone
MLANTPALEKDGWYNGQKCSVCQGTGKILVGYYEGTCQKCAGEGIGP